MISFHYSYVLNMFVFHTYEPSTNQMANEFETLAAKKSIQAYVSILL